VAASIRAGTFIPGRPTRRTLILGTFGLSSLALLSACGASGAASVTSAATSAAVAAPTAASATVSSPTTTAPAATSSAATTAASSAATSVTSSAAAKPVASTASAAKGSGVPLTFWGLGGTPPPGPTSQQIVDEFNQAHPAVKVELDNKPQIGTNTADALTAAIAGGGEPDVVYLGIGLIQHFAAVGALAPIDQYTSMPGFNLADFFPQFLDPPRWQGKLYGTPYVPDMRGLYWNKDLFRAAGLPPDEPPKTWDDLQRMSAALTKSGSGGPAQQLGYVPGWGNPPTYLQWGVNLWQLGGQQLTPDRQKVAYNTPLGVQALQVMVDQTKVVGGYQATQAFNAAIKPPSGLDIFSAGHLGMFSNGVWALKTYDAVSSLSYGVGPLPIPPNGVHTNFSGCPYLCITQASKLHDEAWQLIDYLESPDPLLRFNVADTTLPPRKSVATSAAFINTKPQMKFFVGELATTHLQLYVPGSEEIFKVQSQMYTDVLSGKVSAADGIANSVSQVQAILDKNAASS
jgi:multiple sugar transport system substrate-binding protein